MYHNGSSSRDLPRSLLTRNIASHLMNCLVKTCYLACLFRAKFGQSGLISHCVDFKPLFKVSLQT